MQDKRHEDAQLDARLHEALGPSGDASALKTQILDEIRRQDRAAETVTLPRGWGWMGLAAGTACLAIGLFTGTHMQPADPLSGMEADIASLTFATDLESDQW